MKQVLFLEDHKSVRQGISAALEKLDSSIKIIQAGGIQEAVDALSQNTQIKAAVIDLSLGTAQSNMGGGTDDGLFALSEFRKIVSNLNAIVYTMFSDAENIRRCLAANVQGYVTKSSSVEELSRGIKAVIAGGTYFCREAMEVLTKARQRSEEQPYTQDIFRLYKKLTPKEKEIFILLAKGSSTQEIASLSGKKENTVKNQRTSIYQKLECKDRYELSKAAQELGLL